MSTQWRRWRRRNVSRARHRAFGSRQRSPLTRVFDACSGANTNFASAVQTASVKVRGKKVSMRSLKPGRRTHCGHEQSVPGPHHRRPQGHGRYLAREQLLVAAVFDRVSHQDQRTRSFSGRQVRQGDPPCHPQPRRSGGNDAGTGSMAGKNSSREPELRPVHGALGAGRAGTGEAADRSA